MENIIVKILPEFLSAKYRTLNNYPVYMVAHFVCRILSNTAPSYLECMQRIVFSVADIDAQRDINSFVNDHKHLMTDLQLPQFEPHQCRVR